MNNLAPVTREELFLAKLGGQDVNTPSPMTREELYLDILCGNSANVPAPFAREEIYLASLCGKNVQIPEPVTRKETFLAALCGEGILPPNPVTREEFFLEDWLDNNGEFLTVTGAIATFTTLRAAPLRSLAVTMGPKQDLNGYSYPWPAGGGANQWDEIWEAGSINDSTGKNVSAGGTWRTVNYIPVVGGNSYYLYAEGSGNIRIYKYAEDKSYIGYISVPIKSSFTLDSNVFYLRFRTVIDPSTHNFTINYPSTITTYSPYSNICPISGWTGANVYHSGADTSDATTYSITFPSEAGTVYGGTLDVTTGKLTVSWAKIVLNGTQQISRENWKPQAKSVGWIYPYDLTRNIVGTGAVLQNIKCDTLPPMPFNSLQSINGPGIALASNQTYGISVMYPNTTLTTASAINAFLAEHPIDVVYELAEPVTYQLTPQEVNSLLGENNVWSDADSVTVTYRSN